MSYRKKSLGQYRVYRVRVNVGKKPFWFSTLHTNRKDAELEKVRWESIPGNRGTAEVVEMIIEDGGRQVLFPLEE